METPRVKAPVRKLQSHSSENQPLSLFQYLSLSLFLTTSVEHVRGTQLLKRISPPLIEAEYPLASLLAHVSPLESSSYSQTIFL